ncbi:K1143-like protein [Mya arenaria]|uniref:K1143-like protein n=1 Tax=Mya arenaria TaxID=6604 RepID=A0ABY7ET31_MYAAR|nr:uncharacterized protein KIAA1143 homolog [Mya arenaria]WAR12269.1 K1143-like protein [Mya arenaria]
MANKISYVKNDDPAFIKAFKLKTGYKEGPTIDTKREELKKEEDDRSDNEEEQPTVVVLKSGHLTAEEAQQLKAAGKQEEVITGSDVTAEDEDEPDITGKILFKKPTKRSGDVAQSELTMSSSKKTKHTKEGKTKPTSSSMKTKNASLLSFGDDSEEEEDS